MNLLQKIILFSLISTAGISWILSTFQPDMMKVMNSYNPILVTLYTATWTAGMAAMMFPGIIPMILLYNKLITNNQSDSSQEIVELKFPYSFKVVLFVGMYLVVWAVTGIVLLFGWPVPMNIIASVQANNNIGIVFWEHIDYIWYLPIYSTKE